jgi:hypothetical protein
VYSSIARSKSRSWNAFVPSSFNPSDIIVHVLFTSSFFVRHSRMRKGNFVSDIFFDSQAAAAAEALFYAQSVTFMLLCCYGSMKVFF